MGNNPADIWSWVHSDMRRLSKGEALERALAEHYQDFEMLGSTNPPLAELAINQALDVAKELGDHRWELFLRHWRIQHWLRQSEIKRILPEAIDLLDLALDERVKDVPQRICAYHDVVECYIEMDGAGYYNEIVENAQNVLAQLPKRHPCATCARLNMASAAASAGLKQEAEKWKGACEANLTQQKYHELLVSFGYIHETLEQWVEAERSYQQASKQAEEHDQGPRYIEALLGVARAQLGQGKFQEARANLDQARRGIKYEGNPALIARLAEVDGAQAESQQALPAAIVHFTQAGRIYLDLGNYRRAALDSLHAAELARTLPQFAAAKTLKIAAQAVGALPPASPGVYERLAALGQQPVAPTSAGFDFEENQSEQSIAARELKSLEDILDSYIASGNAADAAGLLHRVGIWQIEHNAKRAALDYLISSAALERLLKLPQRERGVVMNTLERLGKELPAGTVESALNAAQAAPPQRLQPLLSDLPVAQWRWTLQAIATELTGQPVVEPEPSSKDAQSSFQEWLDHYVSMTVLLVRFRDQVEQAKLETWVGMLEDLLQREVDNTTHETSEKQRGFEEFSSLVHGLVALARGAALEEVQQTIAAPFKPLIDQISRLAQKPVWQHPGNWPLDFMVEQVAQKAVKALRRHDEFRVQRLANLAFRYELMTIDLRQHNELKAIADFFNALAALIRNDGQPLAKGAPELVEPYVFILTAVTQSGQEVEESEEDA